jgi:hypothetical protein
VGHECCAGGFVGLAVLTSHQSCHDHVGRAVLFGYLKRKDLVQEGPPLVFLAGVLSVCVWHWSSVYAAPASPVSILTLKGGAMVIGVTPRWSRLIVSLQRAR